MHFLILSILLSVVCGLEYEPKPPNADSDLISYSSDEKSRLIFTNILDTFLAPYKKPRSDKTIIQCENGVPPEEGSNKVCNVDVRTWGPCDSAHGYNYNSKEEGPCVFLKLSKTSNWIPEYYNSSTIPANMPNDLKEHIRKIEHSHGPDSSELKYVWVSCDGENPADKENIELIIYYPIMGFGGQYFPNEYHYLSPLVAVHFTKPHRGVLINIQCKAWAKNLQDETVHFELLVDN